MAAAATRVATSAKIRKDASPTPVNRDGVLSVAQRDTTLRRRRQRRQRRRPALAPASPSLPKRAPQTGGREQDKAPERQIHRQGRGGQTGRALLPVQARRNGCESHLPWHEVGSSRILPWLQGAKSHAGKSETIIYFLCKPCTLMQNTDCNWLSTNQRRKAGSFFFTLTD